MSNTEDRDEAFQLICSITEFLKDALPDGYGVMIAISNGGPVAASIGGSDTDLRSYDDMLLCLAGKLYEARFRTHNTTRFHREEPPEMKQ